MVVKSRYSNNIKENPNSQKFKIKKQVEKAEKSFTYTLKKKEEPKVTSNINLTGDHCLCCEAGCVCCEHPSGTVGHRCECTCVH